MTFNQKIEFWIQEQHVNHLLNRPFVTLSYAQSLDGSITHVAGEPLSLSGNESQRLTHQLRSLHDGILVGIDTVMSDDPQLTVREWPGFNPQPIVLDSGLRIPNHARLCQHPDKTCWIMTLATPDNTSRNLKILRVESDCDGRVDLNAALKLLWQNGIRTLMVEGGAKVISAFLKSELVDALVLTVVPTFVGGYKAVGNLNFEVKQHMPRLDALNMHQLQEDLIIWGRLNYQSGMLS